MYLFIYIFNTQEIIFLKTSRGKIENAFKKFLVRKVFKIRFKSKKKNTKNLSSFFTHW